MAKIFGGDTPGAAIYDFATAMQAPLALCDIGMKDSNLDRAADLATQNPYWNP